MKKIRRVYPCCLVDLGEEEVDGYVVNFFGGWFSTVEEVVVDEKETLVVVFAVSYSVLSSGKFSEFS